MKSRLLAGAMIIFALISGVMAVYLSKSYIEQTIAQKESEIDKVYEPIQVVVAKHNLNPGDVISSETVALRKVPSGFVHSDAVSEAEYDAVSGYALSYPVMSGEPVLRFHVSQRKGGKFAALIDPGKRAVTISVDSLNSAAGMLSPNDRVDLLITTKKREKLLTAPLLGDIRVIATGVETSENPAGEVIQYSTVTLDLTPVEAAKVTHARKVGEISFVLRGGGEQGAPYQKAIMKQHLSPVFKTQYRSKRSVEIIIGGQ